MNRTQILLPALAVLVLAWGAVAGAHDKAGPRETVSVERTPSPAARYAALEIDPADLAGHGSNANEDCVAQRAGPRNTVIVRRGC